MITCTTCSAIIVVGTGYLGAYTLMVIFTDLFLQTFYLY